MLLPPTLLGFLSAAVPPGGVLGTLPESPSLPSPATHTRTANFSALFATYLYPQ